MNTLTVGQLRQLLANHPADMPVAFAYPSGDYWKTMLVGEIHSAETRLATRDDYHNGWKVVKDGDDMKNDDAAVVVLS